MSYNENMRVFRYLHENELNKMLSCNTMDLGVEYGNYKNTRNNTFKYKSGINYLHFYKKQESMQMLSYLYKNLDGNFYFCEFDIPFHILALHGGEGYYPASGYDNITVLKEYAISSDSFDPSWLKSYTLDTNRESLQFSEAESAVK